MEQHPPDIPDQAAVLYNMAKTCQVSEKPDEARNYFIGYVKICKKNRLSGPLLADTYGCLGRLFEEIGEQVKSQKCYKMGIALRQRHVDAQIAHPVYSDRHFID
jgi:hypothetical protein